MSAEGSYDGKAVERESKETSPRRHWSLFCSALMCKKLPTSLVAEPGESLAFLEMLEFLLVRHSF